MITPISGGLAINNETSKNAANASRLRYW